MWLVCALTNTIMASLITLYIYGGASGLNGTAILTVALLTTTKKIFLSVLSSAMLENLIDKGLVFIIAFLIIRKIPEHFLNQYMADTK